MCVAKEVLRERRSLAIFSGPELLARISATYEDRSQDTYLGLLDLLGSVDFLVLEDLAVAKQNEWRLEQLYAVINRRYEDRRPLLVTADVGNPEALGDHIGHRTCSRILEMCEPMPFLDGDHRVRATTPEDVRPGRLARRSRLRCSCRPAAAQQRTVETATNGTVDAELSYIKRTRGQRPLRVRPVPRLPREDHASGPGALRPARRRPVRAVLHADRDRADPEAHRAPRPRRRRRARGDRRPVHRRGELLRPRARVRVRRAGERLPARQARHGRRVRRARPRLGRRDRAGRRRLPLPRAVHLRRVRAAADPDLAPHAAALRGRHARLPRQDPPARPAVCGASTSACAAATRRRS